MASKINEVITGEYDHKGKAIVYGDSVTGDTLIRTDQGSITIAQLYDECAEHAQLSNGKEYGMWCSHKVVGFHGHDMAPMWCEVETVMRHKTTKHLFKVHTANGKQVTVTEDHSMMVDRHGFLMEVKPNQIMSEDLLITLSLTDSQNLDVEYTTCEKVEDLGQVDDHVYDISIRDADPYFFANDCCVKNTDSAYFSAYAVMKNMAEFQEFAWEKEAVTQLYDQIADITNESFPDFMHDYFHVPHARSVIKAGRELVATKGMFITKKRYAVLIYDKEGKRKDVDGKPGEIKAMGLDLKRSDTPKPVQDFLSEVLTMVLTDATKDQVFTRIREFREEFASWPSWAKGTPKRVNNLSHYGELMLKQEGGGGDVFDARAKNTKTIPGHVRAALNYNRLRKIYNDHSSLPIQDGSKIVVCKLRQNPLGMTSIGFPVDQLILPAWFQELPFHDEEMAEALISKKLDNLLGVLGWDLNDSKKNESFDDMFSF